MGLHGGSRRRRAPLIALAVVAGVIATIDNVGIFLGPLLFGLIVDRTGSHAPAWWALVAAAAAAAVLVWLICECREPRRDLGGEPGPEPLRRPARATVRPGGAG